MFNIFTTYIATLNYHLQKKKYLNYETNIEHTFTLSLKNIKLTLKKIICTP